MVVLDLMLPWYVVGWLLPHALVICVVMRCLWKPSGRFSAGWMLSSQLIVVLLDLVLP